MIVVLLVDCLVLFLLKNMYVINIFISGSGLVLIRKKIDLLVLVVCWIFKGEKILWLIVLFRNRILVGLMKIDVSGSRLSCIMICMFFVNIWDNIFINGLIVMKVKIVNSILMILVEKLLISILKLFLILFLI